MLFPDAKPPEIDDCRIVECDAADVARHATGARLVHTDPPWSYRNTGLEGNVGDRYGCITMSQIADHMAAAFAAADRDAYLFLWSTWPHIAAWFAASAAMPWRYVTGGSWHKNDRLGIGFHVRGDTEPWLLYVKGKPRPVSALSNGFASARTEHSEKPIPFLRSVIRAMTEPGDLVLDVYAGLGPCGVAARAEGRQYVGIEIDAERAAKARANVAWRQT